MTLVMPGFLLTRGKAGLKYIFARIQGSLSGGKYFKTVKFTTLTKLATTLVFPTRKLEVTLASLAFNNRKRTRRLESTRQPLEVASLVFLSCARIL